MYKPLSDTHADEVLSDNTWFQKCRQCEDCVKWGGKDPFQNKFDKTSCKAYPYPNYKPIDIINNRTLCEYKVKK